MRCVNCNNEVSFDYYFLENMLIVRCNECGTDYTEDEIGFDYWEDNNVKVEEGFEKLDRRRKNAKNLLRL